MNNYSTGDPEKDAAIQAAISAFNAAYGNYKKEDDKVKKWIEYIGKLNAFSGTLSTYLADVDGIQKSFSTGVRYDDGTYLGCVEVTSLLKIKDMTSKLSSAIDETEKRIMQMKVVVYNAWKKAADAYRNLIQLTKTYPMPDGFSLSWSSSEYDGVINTFSGNVGG